MSLRFDVSMWCTSIEVQARTASQGEMAVKASGLGYTFAGAKRSAVIYRGNTVTFVYYTEWHTWNWSIFIDWFSLIQKNKKSGNHLENYV